MNHTDCYITAVREQDSLNGLRLIKISLVNLSEIFETDFSTAIFVKIRSRFLNWLRFVKLEVNS